MKIICLHGFCSSLVNFIYITYIFFIIYGAAAQKLNDDFRSQQHDLF